jgi:hypothetical protein
MSEKTIEPSPDFLEFTTFTSAIDLTSAEYCRLARPARLIRLITGTGSLVVDTAEHASRTLTLTSAGDFEISQFRRIVSSTGITRVRVVW